MANNNISFDTNDVSSIVSCLNSDSQNLSNLKSTVATTFTPLKNCDLFVSGVEKLSNKLESIKSSYESISTAISGQTNTYSDLENAVENAGNDYMPYYNGGSSSRRSSGGGSSSSEDSSLSDVEQGLAVSTKLDDNIKLIDDKTLINFVNFINIYKGDQASTRDILREENSKYLAIYLQAFFKKYTNIELEISDETLIRKEFLKLLLNAEVDLPKELKENSVIKYKSYLSEIAKNNKVSLGDLFTMEEYKETVKNAISDLYNGKVDYKKYDLESNYQEELKKLVETVSKERKITTDEVLNNPLYLV